jgi:hypothetical protein
VIAVDLLEEGLGVRECIGVAGDAGDDRERATRADSTVFMASLL